MKNSWDAKGAVNQENWGISVLGGGQAKMNLGPWMNHPALPTTLDGLMREKQTLLFEPLYLGALCYSSLACFLADTVMLSRYLLVNRLGIDFLYSFIFWICLWNSNKKWVMKNIYNTARGQGKYKGKKIGYSLVIWVSSLNVRLLICKMGITDLLCVTYGSGNWIR